MGLNYRPTDYESAPASPEIRGNSQPLVLHHHGHLARRPATLITHDNADGFQRQTYSPLTALHHTASSGSKVHLGEDPKVPAAPAIPPPSCRPPIGSPSAHDLSPARPHHRAKPTLTIHHDAKELFVLAAFHVGKVHVNLLADLFRSRT